MPPNPLHPDSPDLNLPPQLQAHLRRLHAPPFPVPPHVDASILAHAHHHLTARRRTRRLLYWSAATVSAAAAILLVTFRLGVPTASSPVQLAQSQSVTILDAFTLARQLRAGHTPDPRWDINHDGTIDQRDVDALARAAVSLKGGRL